MADRVGCIMLSKPLDADAAATAEYRQEVNLMSVVWMRHCDVYRDIPPSDVDFVAFDGD